MRKIDTETETYLGKKNKAVTSREPRLQSYPDWSTDYLDLLALWS